uniref:LysM domain-containing protein n=1 Tax=Anaerobacillus isosaccharinicus TaxID=1532552 RepID=A0A1S2LK93_9BACI
MKIHIVQQGDTLWKLSKKYDVDFEELKQVNSHLSNPDVIMPGMKIKIPTGGVPVKKQVAKKEQLIVAPQPKEVPKQEVVVTPPKEEVKMPAPVPPPPPALPVQPIQHQMTQEQHLHHMNMNFNVYKPMPAKPVPIPMPAPPKLPEMKELPKMEMPKPMPPKKELPKPPAKPMVKPAPMAPPPSFPMQQQCYPVAGIMPGCAPMVPQGYPPMPGFGQMAPQMPYQPAPQQMPYYPQQAQFGMAPPVDMDFDDEGMPPTAPSGSVQVPPMQVPQSQYWGAPNFQGYGDITMQQPMMQQPMMPQVQPWGYQQQPFPQQFNPYDRKQFQYEDEEEED